VGAVNGRDSTWMTGAKSQLPGEKSYQKAGPKEKRKERG